MIEGATFTVKVAAADVILPDAFVNTAWYWLLVIGSVVIESVSVVELAPATSLNDVPPFVLSCHCTVGAGLPLAAAVKLAACPAVTV